MARRPPPAKPLSAQPLLTEEEKRWRTCVQVWPENGIIVPWEVNQLWQVMENLVSGVERQEREAARQRKWTKEYRKGYEKLYRKKKQLQKQMETAIQDRMLKLRKESLKVLRLQRES